MIQKRARDNLALKDKNFLAFDSFVRVSRL